VKTYEISEFLPCRETKYTLIFAYGHEDRVFPGIRRYLEKFQITRVIAFDHQLKIDFPKEKNSAYIEEHDMNKVSIKEYLNEKKIECIDIEIGEDIGDDITKRLPKLLNKNNKILFDITGFFRHQIIMLSRSLDHKKPLFLYTSGELQRHEQLENDYLTMISQRIEILSGFRGYTKVELADLVVLVLGYEGNRSLSFLEKYPGESIIGVVCTPRTDDKMDKFYRDSVIKSNRLLLDSPRVNLYPENLPGYDPIAFSEELENALIKFGLNLDVNGDKYNICISPLSTKLSALGLYFFWKKHNQIQILHSAPMTRFFLSKGVGFSLVVEFYKSDGR
jgi:hypothetical protein